MKKIMILCLSLISTFTLAETRNIDLTISKVKCNMFGNLTLKIDGLSNELGRTGIKRVRSYMSRKACKNALNEVKTYINDQRGSISVEAQTNQMIIYREYLRHDGGPRGPGYPYPYPPYGPGYPWLECEQYKQTDVSFPLTTNNNTYTFKASSSILISRTMGPCPRH